MITWEQMNQVLMKQNILFILRSVRMENWCLAYDPNLIFNAKSTGNYNNQKWDVSENSNPYVNSIRTMK